MLNIYDIAKDIALIVITVLITPYLEGIRAKISKSFKEKYEIKKKILENTAQFVIENPQEEVILRVRINQQNLLVMLGLVAGVLMTATNNIFTLIFGYLFTAIALYGNYKVGKLQKIIYKVNEYKSKANPDIDLELYYRGKKKT